MKSVHVAIDALGTKQSGTSVVLLDLLDALIKNDIVETITLYSAPEIDRSFAFPISEKLRDAPQLKYERSLVQRVLWNARVLADTAICDRADIVVSMAATMRADSRILHVGFVQQSLPFCAEAMETIPVRQRARMQVVQAMTRSSCRGAQRVYVQTATMRSWVSDAFAIDPARCEVVLPDPRVLPVPCEVPPALERMTQIQPGARLLYVGNAEKYKNVETIIRALPLIRAKIPEATLFTTWPTDHPMNRRGDFVGLGYLRDGVLGKAYALADLLVQPSLVESGPLTMTEAMSVGTPVLVADRLYARDICGHASLFFNPRDPTHLAEQAIKIMESNALQSRLIQRGYHLAAVRKSMRPYAQMVASIVEIVQSHRRRGS